MDLSILDEHFLSSVDDSFLSSKPEAMDIEVTQILKKWNAGTPKRVVEVPSAVNPNETFDSRTFTRPKRRIFPVNEQAPSISSTSESDVPSLESGIASINLQVGGSMTSYTPMSMQKSWLNDVSPPSSICTSADFQNIDNMLNSLVTSSDFTDVNFLGNGSDDIAWNKMNGTVTLENVSPTKNITRNLMDFTFDVNRAAPESNATFTADVESPMKEYGIENVDITLSESTEMLGNNLTFDKHTNGDLNWNKIQEHHNQTIVQSTPINAQRESILNQTFVNVSPIRLKDDDEVVIRNVKTRNIVNDIALESDYRDSMEDQCEFLLNEETIKLSSRVYGDTFECLDLKSALIQSADSTEKDFDKMLDSFNVKKSLESEKILQSVDNIKQRHSLINFEKQREEKQKKDVEADNKIQYDTMNKSSERLLRRSRLYDDVNLEVQKQQIETNPEGSEVVSDEVVDKNNRDRFKTIKLNKKLQSGMVIVNDETDPDEKNDINSTSPGTNKERRNKMNQQTQESEDVEFKKPAPVPSKLSKFGFSRPTYRSKNDLCLPLKANSTDSLDNDEQRGASQTVKSPMGVKSKSIHNLMYGGISNGSRVGSNSNLRLASGNTRSQSNLKAPRASSLVRPSYDNGFKVPSAPLYNQQPIQMRAPTSRMTRPSSGYYGNSYGQKRVDSDNESSSSAGSRNNLAGNYSQFQQPIADSNPLPKKPTVTGAIPKATGLRLPSNLRAPQVKSSGLPRPSSIVRR